MVLEVDTSLQDLLHLHGRPLVAANRGADSAGLNQYRNLGLGCQSLSLRLRLSLSLSLGLSLSLSLSLSQPQPKLRRPQPVPEGAEAAARGAAGTFTSLATHERGAPPLLRGQGPLHGNLATGCPRPVGVPSTAVRRLRRTPASASLQFRCPPRRASCPMSTWASTTPSSAVRYLVITPHTTPQP